MLEILLAVLPKIQFAFIFPVVICVVVFFVTWSESKSDSEEKSYWLKRLLLILALAIPIWLIPTPEDLFKVRLALIKYQLASPQNVERGQAYIERIAHELECKYLTECKEPLRDSK